MPRSKEHQLISIAKEDLARLERDLPELENKYGPYWIESQRLDLIEALRKEDDKALGGTLEKIKTAQSELNRFLLAGKDAATTAKLTHTPHKHTEVVDDPAGYWKSAPNLFRSPKLPLPQIRGTNSDMLYILIALIACVGFAVTAWKLEATHTLIVIPTLLSTLIFNYAFIGYSPESKTQNPLVAKRALTTDQYDHAKEIFGELAYHYRELSAWVDQLQALTPLPMMVDGFSHKLNTLDVLGEPERASTLRKEAKNALINQIIHL